MFKDDLWGKVLGHNGYLIIHIGNYRKKSLKICSQKMNLPKAVTCVKLPLSSVVCQNFDHFGIKQGKYENRFFHRKM